MNIWSYAFIAILLIIVILLIIKVHLLRKSAREIKVAFDHILNTNTNRLIDISCRDKYICELAESINIQLRKLRSERQRFQQGNLEIKECITNISHDLRTPLTAICGYIDLLKQEETSEDVNRYIKIIENRTEVLKQLTEELFYYSVVTSILDETSLGDVVLNSVLEESISAYYAVLKGYKITPNISIPEKKIKRKLNKNALCRIFANIISNAVKYSDGDLNIVLSESGEIVFSNHASGLNEIQLGKLFNRFYTVETAKKSTGIGLSIAKMLTEQMNGTIDADYCNGEISIRILFPEGCE